MIIHLYRLPDSELNPNKRLHFRKLAAHKRAAKEEMIARIREQVKGPYTALDKAHITITWITKDKRRRDIDNLMASMKPYIDGLVFEQILIDDSADVVSYSTRYEQGDEYDTIIDIKGDTYDNETR